MKPATLTFEVPESRLRPLVTELRQAIKEDTGTEYSESAIRRSVIAWLDSRLDTLFEDALERLTSPSWQDARDFAGMLDKAEGKVVQLPSRATAEAANVFNGFRVFSLDKMAAMISYFAGRTSDLYKTKLNKLLFYADFVNYYLRGNSISGSTYVHLPYGPVPDGYEQTLETLVHYGLIDLEKQESAERIRVVDDRSRDLLTAEERETLDWVVTNFGSLSASQLTEVSHREKAYSNTRSGEEMAYEYAKFLSKLPQKTA